MSQKIIIIGTAHPYRGGLAAYNERLATALQDAGNEVEIITFSLQYPNFLFPGKTQFADWEAPKHLKIEQKLNSVNPLNWYKVGKEVAKRKPDIVIFKYWLPFMGPSLGTVARVIKSNCSAKVITILDNVIPHESHPGDKVFTKYFVGANDGFIGMSQSVLDDLALFDTTKPRLFNPHPIFDNFGKAISKEEACTSLNIDSSVNYLLFFGIIRKYKGLDWMIEAYHKAELNKKNVKLLVVGEFYTDEKPYRDLVKNLALEDDIIFYPKFIPDHEVNKYFCACDMLVQPYKHATQSGVTQIGYHFEKPMLVTDVGGLGEIIPHQKGGYVLPANVESVSDALNDFYTNDRYNEFVAGIQENKKKFLWERMVEKIDELTQII